MSDLSKKEQIKLYSNKLTALQKLKEKQEKDMVALLLKNFDYLRQFYFNLVSFQLIALGAMLAVLVSDRFSSLGINAFLLYGSILILVSDVVITVLYIHIRLAKEHNGLIDERKQYKEEFETEFNRIMEAVKNKKNYEEYNKEHYEALKEYNKREKTRASDSHLEWLSYLLTGLFMLALILAVASVVI